MLTLRCALTRPPRLLRLRDVRATAFSERTEGLVARHRREVLVEVPLALGLFRLLDAHQIHVVHHAAVLAHDAVLGEEIIHRGLAHLCDHGLGIGRVGGGYRLEIVPQRRVDAGLIGGRHRPVALEELLGEDAGLGRAVPIEGIGEQQIMRMREAERRHVGER
ncbi:hypothetical protein NS44R_14540, partial [Mammaliicoccus sciuri]